MNLNVKQAMAVLLVAFAALGSVGTLLSTIDTSSMPWELANIVKILQYVFLTSSVAPVFTFFRNFYGYFNNKVKAAADGNTVNYEASKLLQTWLTMEGYTKAFSIAIVALTLNTPVGPYAYWIAGALAFMVDLIRKSLAEIAVSRAA